MNPGTHVSQEGKEGTSFHDGFGQFCRKRLAALCCAVLGSGPAQSRRSRPCKKDGRSHNAVVTGDLELHGIYLGEQLVELSGRVAEIAHAIRTLDPCFSKGSEDRELQSTSAKNL